MTKLARDRKMESRLLKREAKQFPLDKLTNTDCARCGHTEAMHDRMRNYHRQCKSFGCGCDDYEVTS